MSELPTLIADLALILISAGIITLIFKRLKQPLVLGYIVAGFLASPHMPVLPSVIDTSNIQTWADIGVVFLLFALGLEFSFKKLMKVGGTAIIAASTIIFCMIMVGIAVGISFGWQRMDCLFLGGMLAMSSTTIIYKAFDDLGLRKQRFAGLVLSILILEDILAIALMVMLSTMAVSNNFEGADMIESIAKLVFFLILCFIVGIYIIPGFLKRAKKWMGDETLLIVSLGMCFGMVVLASKVGFSAAFGAFVMGSILAETIEAEQIDRLVKPVKNLFGAIFFVSVGMMVDPSMIVQYAFPIIVISLAVIIGQALFGTFGVLLSGQPLKTAMQCGFSLTQIGEFAFIIASLGVSLHVTSDFLYPIVVAVSVITTFLTPYMIRIAVPASERMEQRLPLSWRNFLSRYASGSQTVNHENNWKKYLMAIARIALVYSVLSITVITISFQLIIPFFRHHLPPFWASLLGAVFTILAISPFLRAIVVKKNHSVEFMALWDDNHFNRGPLVSTIVLRVVIAMIFVMFVIAGLFKASVGLAFGAALIIVLLMVFSRRLKKQSIMMERKFIQNLRLRDMRAEYMGEKKPEYVGRLLS
ncbi:MAG: cation:proton antiporter, partial [Bacteroidaceae bacterium]